MAGAFYVSQDYLFPESDCRLEALNKAKNIMEAVNKNVNILAERLIDKHYQFVNSDRIITKPDSTDWISELQNKGIYLPISLQAWVEIVGSVNFMGSCPDWHFTGYCFDHADEDKPLVYTDPLVIEVDKDYILYEFENWEYQIKEYGFDEVGPFKIPIAPDALHKAAVSGGPPYEVTGDQACVDSIVFNERHGFSLIAYLRHALSWGGFPGFELIDDYPHDFVNEMRRSLVNI
jgi:hypothetical protein